MSLPAQRIESEALELTESERSRLVLRLLDSLEAPSAENSPNCEQLWVQEAARRYEAHLRGDDPAISAEEVFAEFRKGQD